MVLRLFKKVVTSVSDPSKIYYFQRIRHNDVFKEFELATHVVSQFYTVSQCTKLKLGEENDLLHLLSVNKLPRSRNISIKFFILIKQISIIYHIQFSLLVGSNTNL